MAKIQKLVEIGKAEQGVPVYTLFMYQYTFASGGVYRYNTVHVPVHLPYFAKFCYFSHF